MNGKLFFAIDTLVFFVFTWGILYVRHGGLSWGEFRHQLWAFVPIFLLVSFVLWLFSFYDIKLLRKHVISYKRLAIAFLVTLIGSASVIYFVSALPLQIPTPRRILLVILLSYLSYIYFLRRNYFKLDFAKTNLLFFGESPTLNELLREVKDSSGFRVSGQSAVPEPGKHYQLANLDLVIIGSRLFKEHPESWDIISKDFIAKGAYVDTDFNAYERILRRVSRESIEDSTWLLRGIGSRHEHLMYSMFKRVVDVALALCLLPVLFPLGCLIWVFIRMVDGYPPLFIQKRVGYLEKPIHIYKFRTIRPGGTEEHVTRCGKILRRFRLDEIPQLINVLRGDISFVGPRPIWHNEHEFLKKHVPNHTLRTLVKPGITGWAQLNFKAPPTYFNFRKDTSSAPDTQAFDSAFIRFSYDVWYVKNRSIGLDLDILIRTGSRIFIKDSKVEV